MNNIIIISVFALFIYYVSHIYNKVIRKRNNSAKAFDTVEILLKKRYDLLPNLVDIVKQYALPEASVITEISRINNQFGEESSESEKIELYNSLNRQVNTLLVNITNHPELKSSRHFLKLQAAWNETEEQISAATRYYNAAVSDYNNAIQTFPAGVLINKSIYPPKQLLEITVDEQENVSAGKLFKGNQVK